MRFCCLFLPRMGLIHPMVQAQDVEDSTHSEVDRKFIAAISSIGYGKTEQLKLCKRFDISAKITTIVSLQTPEDKRNCIKRAISILKVRHSLMHLLFLRKILEGRHSNSTQPASESSGSGHRPSGSGRQSSESGHRPSESGSYDLTIGREQLLFQIFMSLDPLEIINYSLESSNKIFLNNVVELLLFILQVHKLEFNILYKILIKYHIIDISLITNYLELSKDISKIYANNGINSGSFLQLMINDIIGLKIIKSELDFIWKKECQINGILTVGQLIAAQNKFEDKNKYEKISEYIKRQADIKRNTERDLAGVQNIQPNVQPNIQKVQQVQLNVQQVQQTVKETEPIIKMEEIKRLIDECRKYKKISKSLEKDVKELKEQITELEIKNKNMERDLKSKNEQIGQISKSIERIDKPSKVVCEKVVQKVDGKSEEIKSGKIASVEQVGGVGRAAKPRVGRFGAGRTKQAEPRISKFSAKHYVGLPWSKCSKQSCGIFTKIDPIKAEDLFKADEFAEFEKSNKIKVKEEKRTSEVQAKSVTGCIDQKKAHALNIALSRIKLTNSVLIDEILDLSLVNESLVTQLIAYFPSSAELEALALSEKTDEPSASRSEELFREVTDHVKFYNALLALRFSYAFNSKKYIEEVQKLNMMCDSLLTSQEVVRLFECMLAVGNILNVNTFGGSAEGFTIESVSNFNKPEIIKLINKRIDCKLLCSELGMVYTDAPTNSDCLEFIAVFGLFSVETLTQEISELKKVYVEESVPSNLLLEYSKLLDEFSKLEAKNKEICSYFGDKMSVVCEKIASLIKMMLNTKPK